MSLRYRKLPDGTVEVLISPHSVAEFKQLVFRASNTWQDMSNDMDDFCQIVTNGRVIQPRVIKRFKCSECRTIPCSCTFTHY